MREWQVGALSGATVASVSILALVRRYVNQELQVPKLIHGVDAQDLEDQRLLLEVQLLLMHYWPHPLIEFSGYVSTSWIGIWALRPVVPQPPAEQLEVVTLRDGGTVSLHWFQKPTASKKPVVLVLPGINNQSGTSFVQTTMRHLEGYGFRAVALNYRGVGSLELTSPRLGLMDSWQDLPEVVAHLEATRPGAELFAVGFSMGALTLMNYLGDQGAKARFRAAVGIAGPMDLEQCAADISSPQWKKRVISFTICHGVKHHLFSKLVVSPFSHLVDRDRVRRIHLMRGLDEIVSELHGYRDVDDYYARNSPRPRLANISVPTLLLNSADDPVVSFKCFPKREVERNHHIYAAVSRRGGHIGHGGGGLGPDSWADTLAARFLQVSTRPRGAPLLGATAQSKL